MLFRSVITLYLRDGPIEPPCLHGSRCVPYSYPLHRGCYGWSLSNRRRERGDVILLTSSFSFCITLSVAAAVAREQNCLAADMCFVDVVVTRSLMAMTKSAAAVVFSREGRGRRSSLRDVGNEQRCAADDVAGDEPGTPSVTSEGADITIH